MALDELGEHGGAMPAAVAGQLVGDRAEVQGVVDVGLVQRPLDRAGRDDLAEIEQRAGDGCHRDAVDVDHVPCGVKGPAAVHRDAAVTARAAAADGHVDP